MGAAQRYIKFLSKDTMEMHKPVDISRPIDTLHANDANEPMITKAVYLFFGDYGGSFVRKTDSTSSWNFSSWLLFEDNR